MPKLQNERHELYALHRAKGMSPAKAQIAAGYASGSSTSSGLEKEAEIQRRIEELLVEIADRRAATRAAAEEAGRIVGEMTGTSKAWVIEQLAKNAKNAADDGDYGSSNSALRMIGDEFGMFKGASAGEDNDPNAPPVMDLSRMEALLPPDLTQVAPDLHTPSINEAALRLVEGHAPKAARTFDAHTEANVAFEDDPRHHEDEEEDEEFDPEELPE